MALATVQTSTLKEMQWMLRKIPLGLEDDTEEAFKIYEYSVSNDFSFIRDMLQSALRDPDLARGQEKAHYLIGLIEPQFGMWAAGAGVDQLRLIVLGFPGFQESFASDTWNRSHLFVLDLLRCVSKDRDITRREDKINFVFDLLNQKKAAFRASPDRELLTKAAAENQFMFRELAERGFFLPRPDGWVPGSSAADMKTALWDTPGFAEKFASETWNESHLMVLGLMHDAAGDDFKMAFLFSMLSQKKAVFHAAPDREFLMKIIAGDERVFKYLEKKSFFST